MECEAVESNQQELKSPASRTELPDLPMWVVTMDMILRWIHWRGVRWDSLMEVRKA